MTTVIVDFKNKKVYADKTRTSLRDCTNSFLVRAFIGESAIDEYSHFDDGVCKLRTTSDGCILTGVGNADVISAFGKYPSCIPDTPKSSTDVVILRSKENAVRVIRYSCSDRNKIFGKKKWIETVNMKSEGYLVLGSGKNFALGALYSGASPAEAILAASKLDPFTSSSYDVQDIPNCEGDSNV